MGKQRRQRNKFHISPKQPTPIDDSSKDEKLSLESDSVKPPLLEDATSNIFAGLKIDITSLNKNLNDDTRSVKSFKSVKSELGKDVALSKKDKLRIRREMFLKKLDMVSEAKKKSLLKKQNKKKLEIIGDTNLLKDALPSLETLLKSRGNVPYKQENVNNNNKISKVKGIAKVKKQKKNYLQGVNMYKQILKNKQFINDPLNSISQHIKNVVAENHSK